MVIFPLKMVIFNSYVKLPEGIIAITIIMSFLFEDNHAKPASPFWTNPKGA